MTHVLLTVSDGVAHLELNRPEVFNSLSVSLCEALEAAVTSAAEDDAVKVVLLSGAGKAFCAGGDVKAMAAAPDTAAFVSELIAASHRGIAALDALQKPVVAAVHGSVAGAGLGLIGAADLVLAGASTKFVSAFTAIGLTPDSGTSYYLARAIGSRRAAELVITNRALTAEVAADWGLITSVHADDEVLAAATALATKLAAGPAAAYGKARRLVRAASESTLSEHLDLEARWMGESAGTDEAQALIQAFASR